MTYALISVTPRPIGSAVVQTVNARELHEFLEVGKDFSTWIKERIEQYGFAVGQDFSVAQYLSPPKSGSAKARPQTRSDYHLSLDMAKELAMVERTARGKQARQYFIECERRALSAPATPAPLDPAALAAVLVPVMAPRFWGVHRIEDYGFAQDVALFACRNRQAKDEAAPQAPPGA